jgi:hypothetical protein
MAQWEYREINLNDLPQCDDVGVLAAAGKEGWELVAITDNGIAYLKRRINDSSPVRRRRTYPRG